MSTSHVTCDLCGTEQEVESYGDYKCSNCGQEHCYDNDCYRIMLTEEQEEVLRQHRNGGIMIVVDREYFDGFKSALEAEEQERQKTGKHRAVVEVPQEYLDVFKPGNLSDTILQASVPDVKQYYKQALGRLNRRFRGRSDELTDEQILNMTKEEAVNLITNSVYAATELMERLEAAGKLRGNGHHARQAVSLKAEEEINTRWRGLGDESISCKSR